MILELEGIHKAYGRKTVLKNISLTANEGSCVGILGGNGCGKSTLLSILAGVQKADGGQFVLDGVNLSEEPKMRSSLVGYVPQTDPLIEELNAWDNLRMWYGRDYLKKELSEGILSVLGIDSFLKVPVRKMSGGMKKRLSIGCAVAGKPKVLLLDEPAAALDLVCKEHIYDYFRQFTQSGGIIIMATHDTQEIELCDRCFILKNGVLSDYVYDGDFHNLAGRL
jgi:ABC-2 type transport system ATP-binding protein